MSTPTNAKIVPSLGLTYDEVLIVPQYSEVRSRNDVDLAVELAPGLTLTSPIIPSNMDTVVSVELCVRLHELGGIGNLHQFQSIEKQVLELKEVKSRGAKVAASTGVTKDYIDRARALIENGVDLIIFDTPHAHHILTIEAVKAFRKEFGAFPLIAGNIATPEAAEDLIKAGVDGVKVGVGPGAACLTRVNAGSGYPQLSAVLAVGEVTKKYGKSLIADGGIKTPGNFAKAIGAGGTIAMMGSVLAGVDEAPSDLVERDGKRYKTYRGSSSEEAKMARSKNDQNYKNAANEYVEGAAGLVKYQGSLESFVQRFNMGLRSAMSYSGARTITEFHENVKFVQISPVGILESGAHGLVG
jgi:IMP dehydrogenase